MSASDHLSPEQFKKGDIVHLHPRWSGDRSAKMYLTEDAVPSERHEGYVALRGNAVRVKDNMILGRTTSRFAHRDRITKVER